MKNVPDGTLFNRQFCVGAPQNCCDRSGKISYAILPRDRSKRRSDKEENMQEYKWALAQALYGLCESTDLVNTLSSAESYAKELEKKSFGYVKNDASQNSYRQLIYIFSELESADTTLLSFPGENHLERFHNRFPNVRNPSLEEVSYWYTLLDGLNVLQNNISEDDCIRLYRYAGFETSRYELTRFLCRNRSDLFHMDANTNHILWPEWEDTVQAKLHSDEASEIFSELGLQKKKLPKLHYKRLQEACEFYSNEKTPPASRLYSFLANPKFNRPVTQIECYFLYFQITENRPQKRGAGLWDDLFAAAGFDSELTWFPYVQNAITYWVIQQRKEGLDEWISQQKSWLQESKAYRPHLNLDPLLTAPEDKGLHYKPRIEYDIWKKQILGEDLLKDNSAQTRRSISYINANMNQWGNPAIRTSIIETTLDTEIRRRWYFCRIIGFILEHQIQELREATPESREVLKERCWLDDDQKRIVLDKITNAFNFYFEGMNWDDAHYACAMGRLKIRNRVHGKTEDPAEADQDLYELRCGRDTINALIQQNEYVHNPKRERELPFNRKVSRELLLMTVLLAGVFGVMIDMNYVKNNILFNSRFGNEFRDTFFDRYFLETFEKIRKEDIFEVRARILKEASWTLEEHFLDEGVAVFQRALLAKR